VRYILVVLCFVTTRISFAFYVLASQSQQVTYFFYLNETAIFKLALTNPLFTVFRLHTFALLTILLLNHTMLVKFPPSLWWCYPTSNVVLKTGHGHKTGLKTIFLRSWSWPNRFWSWPWTVLKSLSSVIWPNDGFWSWLWRNQTL